MPERQKGQEGALEVSKTVGTEQEEQACGTSLSKKHLRIPKIMLKDK